MEGRTTLLRKKIKGASKWGEKKLVARWTRDPTLRKNKIRRRRRLLFIGGGIGWLIVIAKERIRHPRRSLHVAGIVFPCEGVIVHSPVSNAEKVSNRGCKKSEKVPIPGPQPL